MQKRHSVGSRGNPILWVGEQYGSSRNVPARCRANVARVRQSGPESGPRFQIEHIKPFTMIHFRATAARAHSLSRSSESCLAQKASRRPQPGQSPLSLPLSRKCLDILSLSLTHTGLGPRSCTQRPLVDVEREIERGTRAVYRGTSLIRNCAPLRSTVGLCLEPYGGSTGGCCFV